MHTIAALVASKLRLTIAKAFGDKYTSTDSGVTVTMYQWRGVSYITNVDSRIKPYFIEKGYIYRYVDAESESVCIASCINHFEANFLIDRVNSMLDKGRG